MTFKKEEVSIPLYITHIIPHRGWHQQQISKKSQPSFEKEYDSRSRVTQCYT